MSKELTELTKISVQVADESHLPYVDTILNTIADAAKIRGTGIAKRTPEYIEQKIKREYVGGSAGVSIRIARGVYYRIGAFKGHPIEKSHAVHVDTGILGITNKHIYFYGHNKKFRIKYEKIVSFESYSDGIGLQKDAVTAKPQIFVTGDGWFTYNLITNLSNQDF